MDVTWVSFPPLLMYNNYLVPIIYIRWQIWMLCGLWMCYARDLAGFIETVEIINYGNHMHA